MINDLLVLLISEFRKQKLDEITIVHSSQSQNCCKGRVPQTEKLMFGWIYSMLHPVILCGIDF